MGVEERADNCLDGNGSVVHNGGMCALSEAVAWLAVDQGVQTVHLLCAEGADHGAVGVNNMPILGHALRAVCTVRVEPGFYH